MFPLNFWWMGGGSCNTFLSNDLWTRSWWSVKPILCYIPPEEGNLRKYNHYTTINLIIHPVKVMLRITVKHLKWNKQRIVVWRSCRIQRWSKHSRTNEYQLNTQWKTSTTSKRPLQNCIDLKEAFDRVWHAVLLNNMKGFHVREGLIQTFQVLYADENWPVLPNNQSRETGRVLKINRRCPQRCFHILSSSNCIWKESWVKFSMIIILRYLLVEYPNPSSAV